MPLGDQLGDARADALARRPAANALPSISFASAIAPRIHWAAMIRSAIEAGSPAMLTVLLRAVTPRMTSKADFGSRHAAASSSITASLALPSSGGAVTAAFSAPLRDARARRDGRAAGREVDRHARGGAAQEHRIGGRHQWIAARRSTRRRLRMKNRPSSRMTGEMSTPPRLGRKRRIGRSIGSVSR